MVINFQNIDLKHSKVDSVYKFQISKSFEGQKFGTFPRRAARISFGAGTWICQERSTAKVSIRKKDFINKTNTKSAQMPWHSKGHKGTPNGIKKKLTT